MERLRLTKDRLKQELSQCDLKPGDSVLMHSGLKALGWVEGGADSVIDVLLELLGPQGTLMVPAFSYCYAGRPGTVPFDPKTTPGSRNGAIADRLRQRTDAVRSAHPSHSFAAIGKNAHFLCDHHPLEHAVSGPSPLTRLLALHGKVLFLGCGTQSNVMLHLAEALADFRYDHLPFRPVWGEEYWIASPDGPIRRPVREHPGCDNLFPMVAELLLQERKGSCHPVGMSEAFMFSAEDILDKGLSLLKQKPDIFLCHDPSCEACGPRREYLKSCSAISEVSAE